MTAQWCSGWFERLLCRLLEYHDIVKQVEGETTLYLRRFFLMRAFFGGKHLFSVYLHRIARSDEDPDPHDHPFAFVTLPLRGYVEEYWTQAPWLKHVRWVYPFWLHFRKAEHIHRVILAAGQAWTLVLAIPKGREWGFWPDGKFVPWKRYLGLPEDFKTEME